jgi:hypothetical protein
VKSYDIEIMGCHDYVTVTLGLTTSQLKAMEILAAEMGRRKNSNCTPTMTIKPHEGKEVVR